MKSTQLLLSAVVLTKNEDKNIKRCLSSLSFCDEIVVIDDYSTDNTVSIAKKMKAHVYTRPMKNNFAAQRNYGLKKTRGSWILFVDADEFVTAPLAKEIHHNIERNGSVNGYYLRRIDNLWGKEIKHGELSTFGAFGNGLLLRLGKKGSGEWSRNIHEIWNIKGKTDSLHQLLIHYPHQSLNEFINDIGERSAIHADMLLKEGKKSSLIKIITWPLGKFIYNYIFRLGFLDGMRGFMLAAIMSFHSFISWTYLWTIKR